MPFQKKVLVTGGCGFIGSHLVIRLLSAGYTVTVIDNLKTGKKNNLKGVLSHPGLNVIEKDICEYSNIEEYFDDQEGVFHLAALADIVPSIDHPEAYFEANVTGTFNILEASRKYKVKKIMYAASSSCYGVPTQYPTSESSPIQVEYPYALTKTLGEQMVLHWGKVYRLDVISFRLFNVFGPNARSTGQYGAVFGVFLAQKFAGKPLTVVGDGSQTRDFIYVDDVVEAFLLAFQSDLKNEIFNVGSGNPHSVHELTQLLDHPVTFIPKRPGEPDCTWADISKIQRLLHWNPQISFSEGVTKMLDHVQCWKDAPVWTAESIQKATQSWFEYLR